MHVTAYQNAAKFVKTYVDLSKKMDLTVVDIGSYDVNGTMKPLFPGVRYIGVDQSPGPNVDVVASADKVPLDAQTADVVVSSSCFEHDVSFWETFLEMVRIAKPNGYIYICAPSAGPYHGYPGDCWRFYKDSWKALATWGTKKGYNVSLVESYIDTSGNWKDSVGIFRRLP